MKRALILLLPLITLACAGPLTGATGFDYKYFASGGATPPSLPACAGPIDVSVTDPREKPVEMGRRFEEDKPSVVWPIAMNGDTAGYVQKAIEAILQRAGNPGRGTTASALQAQITQITLEERTFHNAEFSGSVGLDLTLVNPAQGGPCWKGKIIGSGTDYGKAGNPENYQETLNRSIERAMADLLAQKDFQHALCGQCASAAR
jgi:hypothetical protein